MRHIRYYLNVDLVSCQHDGDVFANTNEVTVPVGNVLVGNAGGDVEHNDGALPLNAVEVMSTSKQCHLRRTAHNLTQPFSRFDDTSR